jgi:hypothetical protein
MLSLKSHEANIWYNKLLENDKLLENAELNLIKTKSKAKRKNKFCFGLGIVAGFFIARVF